MIQKAAKARGSLLKSILFTSSPLAFLELALDQRFFPPPRFFPLETFLLVGTGGAGGRLGISSAAATAATTESGTNGGAVPDRVGLLVVVGVAIDSAEGVDVGSGVAARGSAGVAVPEGAFDAGTEEEDSCPSICFCHNSGNEGTRLHESAKRLTRVVQSKRD